MKFTGFSIINLGSIPYCNPPSLAVYEAYPENCYYFYIFIMFGPLNLFALLGLFYGTTGRLFTLRQWEATLRDN
ncbi:MAG: hypothetical protein R2727_06665 [Bacteroidales bacterium]